MTPAKAAEPPIRVGTRASRLALWQAERVAAALRAAHPGRSVVLVPIESSGDRHGDTAVADLGIIGIFTREIEHALLDQRIDVAVHSFKDLPTTGPAGLVIAAVLPRDDPRDALVAPCLAAFPVDRRHLDALAPGARIATSSLRRRAEILRRRPDCAVVELRGNVPTRIAKALEGEVDAVVVSQAGLDRLALVPPGHTILDPAIMMPAPAQGTIVAQVRSDDSATHTRVAALDDPETRLCTRIERAVLAALRGGCRVPLGVLAQVDPDGTMIVHGRVATPDGTRMIEATASGTRDESERLARRVADDLRSRGADAILEALDRL